MLTGVMDTFDVVEGSKFLLDGGINLTEHNTLRLEGLGSL